MPYNPILSELYEIRSKIFSDHRDDLNVFLHSEFERLKSAGHPIAQIRQRTLRRTDATKANTSATRAESSPPNAL